MKTNDIKQFFAKVGVAGLTSQEKEAMRSDLLAFMQEHPVRNAQGARLQGQERKQKERASFWPSPLSFLQLKKLSFMPIIASFIITILVSGGAALAAENSLPGNPLYSFKVNITEEVRSSLALSDDAQAKWEAERAERRLKEAGTLAANAELTADVKVQIEENFKRHADKTNELIAKLEAKENFRAAADVSSNLEISLRVHARILTALSAQHDGEVSSLVLTVRDERDSAHTSRTRSEASVSAGAQTDRQEAAEGALKAAENKIEEVKKFIENKKEVMTAASLAAAEAKVQVAQDLVVQGKAKVTAAAYGEAFILFKKAHRTAQEAKLLVELEQSLNVTVEAEDED